MEAAPCGVPFSFSGAPRATVAIRAICERMADLGARVRASITAVTAAGDDTTADIFVAGSRQFDKDPWLIESHLGEAPKFA